MTKSINPDVANLINTYPKPIQKKLLALREIIYDAASQTEGVGVIEETLKWGEPSYLTKGGSTIRINWKKTDPQLYAMYFHCQTKLVDTFKERYRDTFSFEANRAIIFHLNDKIPTNELMQCIAIVLTYHHRKKLPMLGI